MCLEGRRETGRERLSLGPRERVWVQEGRARGWPGCRPGGFGLLGLVEAPVCVPSLLGCQIGIMCCCGGRTVLKPHQQPVTWHFNSPSFVLRCGRGASMSGLLAASSLLRQDWLLGMWLASLQCSASPQPGQLTLRPGSATITSPCLGWLCRRDPSGTGASWQSLFLLLL